MSAKVITTVTLDLSQTAWTDLWDHSINPVEATSYCHLSTPSGLMLQTISHEPDSAWLCKNVVPLPNEAQNVTFGFTQIMDAAGPLIARANETDMKLTDSQGWTYDGSLRIMIDGTVQVSGPWKPTSVKVPPFPANIPVSVSIVYKLDYVAHTITFVSISVVGASYPIGMTFPAKQPGWAKSEIVTQLQPMNAVPGGYTLTFTNAWYVLQ